jgi:hypothetical protein
MNISLPATDGALLANFEARLPGVEREDIRRSVRRGITDIEKGRFDEYDAEAPRGLCPKGCSGLGQKASVPREDSMTTRTVLPGLPSPGRKKIEILCVFHARTPSDKSAAE